MAVTVFVVERAAPEEEPEIVLCASRAEERELFALCERMQREVYIAESSPHAAWFEAFKEAYAGR